MWRYNYVGDAKTVDVHVRWLRQKFAGRAPFEIVTVRGVGYRADRENASPGFGAIKPPDSGPLS